MKILFLTWDGPQVSYLEGLFLPIFVRLQRAGLKFHVLQFTWGDAARVEATRKACEAAGIAYRATPVWRHPVGPGALLTAFAGARLIRKTAREWSIDVLMPRSNLPAFACLLALRRMRLPLVFDADGLPLDERVDFGGQSPSAWAHRFLRDIEAQTVRSADKVLTRSLKAADILLARGGAGTSAAKFHIVSNGRDTTQFTPGTPESRDNTRQRLDIVETAPLLVYAGSIGPQYCVFEMFELLALVHRRRPDARLLMLTGSPELVFPVLSRFPALQGAISIMRVSAQAVPELLACADLGLAFRKSSFSMQGVAPIKLGEYLLCGLPVVATRGIGDTAVIEGQGGFLLESMDVENLEHAAHWFVESVLPQRQATRNKCRSIGENNFSIESSAESYAEAFASLSR